MTKGDLDPTRQKYEYIADHLGCAIELVEQTFLHDGRLYTTLTPEFLRAQDDAYRATVAFEKSLKELIARYQILPHDVLQGLHHGGAPTLAQLDHFAEMIADASQSIVDRHLANYSRAGGKNWHAETVALRMASLFHQLDREITFGENGGKPSTPFGHAVKFAFATLDIDANWKAPTRKAWRLAKSPPVFSRFGI